MAEDFCWSVLPAAADAFYTLFLSGVAGIDGFFGVGGFFGVLGFLGVGGLAATSFAGYILDFEALGAAAALFLTETADSYSFLTEVTLDAALFLV